MTEQGSDLLDEVPAFYRAPLADMLSGRLAPGMALTGLLMETDDPALLAATLEQLGSRLSGQASERLAALRDLHAQFPDAWRQVRGVLQAVDHESIDGSPGDAVTRVAAMFDRAAAISPEASVALYSLGDAGRLAAATAEVVDRLREWGVLGRDCHVLEIGCGIGRFVAALAPDVAAVTGLDISEVMVETARQRCAGLANAVIRQTDGQGLAGIPDASMDLVLAADSFPYIVQAGDALADRHVAEAARVLRPGGSLVILNFAYRGDPARDAADAAALAHAHGFTVLRSGERPFREWDARAFHLKLLDDV